MKDVLHIGFTGSRDGMTHFQSLETLRLLTEMLRFDRHVLIHHGDCEGADTIMHCTALKLGIKSIIHPPANDYMRAYNRDYHSILEPKDYLERDRNIVNCTSFLIATPKHNNPPPKGRGKGSGTWYTVNYARKQWKRIILIKPNSVEIE